MKHKQDPVYLSYVLSTENAQKQKSKGKIKSKVVHTNATDIGESEIPLPPLEVQKRIVEVLDNFEKICNDLNIGLPAEIEARQKQYEYYRNIFLSLITFLNCYLLWWDKGLVLFFPSTSPALGAREVGVFVIFGGVFNRDTTTLVTARPCLGATFAQQIVLGREVDDRAHRRFIQFFLHFFVLFK